MIILSIKLKALGFWRFPRQILRLPFLFVSFQVNSKLKRTHARQLVKFSICKQELVEF